MEVRVKRSVYLAKLALAGAALLALGACVYEPAPAYPAYPSYGYYAPPPAYYYGPSVSLGFGFHDHDGGHWRHWR